MKKITKILISSISLFFIVFNLVGASTIPSSPAIFETSLSFPLATTDTSMTLVSITLLGGATLPAGYSCFTIDQGQPNTEYICGIVSGTTISSLVRGIDPLTGNTSDSNLVFSHRRGADVKITDFPVLGILKNILNGQDTLPGPISYGTGVNPIGGQDLTTKSYVLSVVNGGVITYNQVIVAGVAGQNLSIGNILYLNSADGRWYKAVGSNAATVYGVQLGIAQGAGTTGGVITAGVLINGVDTNNTGTAGTAAYVSNSIGVIGSAGTVVRQVGQYIPSSGGIYFNPTIYNIVTNDQMNALSGGGSLGTPSSSNKYLTQNYISSSTTNPTIQVITSSGTYTAPAGLKYAVVEVLGGGGGGQAAQNGGSSFAGQNGGAGGGYAKKTITAATIGASQTVTIGTGGAGGTTSLGAGSDGVTTSFGAIVTATGGKGGSSATPSVGGIGSSGDINVRGNPGIFITTVSTVSGAGGGSFFGGGGAAQVTNNAAGNVGGQYGGGGSGGGGGGAQASGGAGATGVIIVTEYYQ